jgi:hypothetical protein
LLNLNSYSCELIWNAVVDFNNFTKKFIYDNGLNAQDELDTLIESIKNDYQTKWNECNLSSRLHAATQGVVKKHGLTYNTYYGGAVSTSSSMSTRSTGNKFDYKHTYMKNKSNYIAM